MIRLFISEWKRFWLKKIVWLTFLSISIIILLTVKYSLNVNTGVEELSPYYVSAFKLPIAVIQEQLMLVLNSVVILWVSLVTTYEYESGQIRLVQLRAYRLIDIYIAKYLVIIINLFILLLSYMTLSFIIGYFTLPRLDNMRVFNLADILDISEVIKYTVKYYLLSFISLSVISMVIGFICSISKSIVISISISFGILLCSIVYGYIAILFYKYVEVGLINMPFSLSLMKLKMLSIAQIQFEGISRMIGDMSFIFNYNMLILLIYFAIFSILNLCFYLKKDKFI